MDSVFIFLILIINYISRFTADDTIQSYKISMVSSEADPSQPAMFQHCESPVWDADSQSLYFVDVYEQKVHRLDYTTGKILSKHIAFGQVNVVSLIADSKRLLVAVRSSLFLLDWAVSGDQALRLLTTLDAGQPDNVINEGKPDTEGRFWCGTKGPQTGDDMIPDKATLYSIEQETVANPRVQVRPVSISNGLAWAPNNTVLYYIDSPTQKVEAFDYEPTRGDLSARRTIVDISNYGFEDAIPDGMTIDSKGYLWVALMFGGTILHIDPDSRQVVYGYKIPVSRVTSVCWGGPNLDELFVTTGRDIQDSDLEPLAGAIFTIRNTGSRGLQSNLFKFQNADIY